MNLSQKLSNLKSPWVPILSIRIWTICWNGKFWSFSKYAKWYTNRRKILRWFQKCILLHHYLEHLMSYCIFKAKFVTYDVKWTNLTLKMQLLIKYSRQWYKSMHFWNQRKILRRLVCMYVHFEDSKKFLILAV